MAEHNLDSYIAHSVFDSLQAEDEADWLAQVFVAPPDFRAMAGARSVAIVGESGSGKTALRLALADYAIASGRSSPWLLVEWQPVLMPLLQAVDAARALMTQVLGECAAALLRALGHSPENFHAAAAWAQELARWFIHRYLPSIGHDDDLLLSRLAEQATTEGAALQVQLISLPPRSLPQADLPEQRLLSELTQVVQRLGFAGFWVLVDGLERLAEYETEALTQAFRSLLATLALFEEQGFAIKLFAPPALEALIAASGGVVRRRVGLYRLGWTEQQLETIVARRLALFVGRTEFNLAELYARGELLGWLTQYGGNLPRGWLDHIRPLAHAYQSQGAMRPLSRVEWLRTIRAAPPLLRIDAATQRVFVGYTEIHHIQPLPCKLLFYLYANRERICTRSELFYRALKGLDYEPQHFSDSGYEQPASYEGMLNNNVLRLREAIEPDAKQPIFVITVRGKGLRLNNAL